MLKATRRSEKEAGDLLGTYLLQGWIMTDEICTVDSCSFPLMRSKDGSLSFCTLHDTLPTNGAAHHYNTLTEAPNTTSNSTTPSAATTITETPVETREEVMLEVIDNGEDELRKRRERREQSSKASQLIGQKMLQRWALLNDHCPNPSCYAVPLIRNPDTKQMYCVICENIILTEEEALELEKKNKQEESTIETKRAPTVELSTSPTTTTTSTCQKQRVAEEHKRQKIEPVKNRSRVDSIGESVNYFSSDVVVSTLSAKMDQLTERVETCHDAEELCKLFKSIKQCAAAIQACVEAAKTCNKN